MVADRVGHVGSPWWGGDVQLLVRGISMKAGIMLW